jgi:pimeloyl-ACP methyl ester carboxylesterase
VDRLVLVDAAGFKLEQQADGSIAEALNPSTRAAIKKIMTLVFYNAQMFGTDAAVDQFFARKLAAGDGYTIARFIDAYGRGEDILDGRVSAIKHRTLIVWGRQDGLTPLAWGERFKKEIAGSELVIFDKCGHVPQLEKAAEFNAAVMKFLEGSK